MNQQIRMFDLLQCGFKGIYQRVRQSADKTHRIHQNKLMVGVKSDAALLSIQRGKEHIFFKDGLFILFR